MVGSDSKNECQTSTISTNYRNYLCNNILWDPKMDSFVPSVLHCREGWALSAEAQDEGNRGIKQHVIQGHRACY